MDSDGDKWGGQVNLFKPLYFGFPFFTEDPTKLPTSRINDVCYVNVIFVIK